MGGVMRPYNSLPPTTFRCTDEKKRRWNQRRFLDHFSQAINA
tara:strand:+ start:9151 stop:9276 length:126 start_codon:yes stop_codon:yes gene_type:complete